MVCSRCIMVVSYEFKKLGIPYTKVVIGKVETSVSIEPYKIDQLKLALLQSGLELTDNKKSILVEKIKKVIFEMVHYNDHRLKINFSDHLGLALNHDYTYLANIFSEDQGTTIENYIIRHKIQRVKELISDNELNLTEISWKLHYSSVAHLSTQFKKVTGITPSDYKHLEHHSGSLANV